MQHTLLPRRAAKRVPCQTDIRAAETAVRAAAPRFIHKYTHSHTDQSAA